MAWESRNGRGRYYTRSRKLDGRVVREYFGSGEMAQLIAESDALDRQLRETARAEQSRQCDELRERDALVASICDAAQLWGTLALLAAGYRRHDRGEWRRRREQR